MNFIDIWGSASVYEKGHKYVTNDLNIFNVAQICGKRLKNMSNGLYCVGNDLRISQSA